MVDEVREVSIEGGINCVDVLLAQIEVQIKQVGSTLGVVLSSPLLSHVAGDDLPDILHHEGARLDVLHGLDSPPTAVVRPEDGQLMFPAFLDQPVGAVEVTGAPLVTLVQRRTNLALQTSDD